MEVHIRNSLRTCERYIIFKQPGVSYGRSSQVCELEYAEDVGICKYTCGA
jgi:hypothetical protein